jgi:hypothetical protein
MLKDFDEELVLGEKIRAWIQGCLDEDANPAMLASLLTLHATKLGLELGYDPRLVMINGLNSMSAALSIDLDNDFEDLSDSEDVEEVDDLEVHFQTGDSDQPIIEDEGHDVPTGRILH